MASGAKKLFEIHFGDRLHENGHIPQVGITSEYFDQVNMVQPFEYLELVFEFFNHLFILVQVFLSMDPLTSVDMLRCSTKHFVNRTSPPLFISTLLVLDSLIEIYARFSTFPKLTQRLKVCIARIHMDVFTIHTLLHLANCRHDVNL